MHDHLYLRKPVLLQPRLTSNAFPLENLTDGVFDGKRVGKPGLGTTYGWPSPSVSLFRSKVISHGL